MRTLTTDEFRTLRDEKKDLLVINVLKPEEFEKKHIPDSLNIPVGRDDFVDEVERVAGSRERPVVVYCASTKCDASPKAAKKLDEAGFTNVYDFEGGMKAWSDAGLAIERAEATRTR